METNLVDYFDYNRELVGFKWLLSVYWIVLSLTSWVKTQPNAPNAQQCQWRNQDLPNSALNHMKYEILSNNALNNIKHYNLPNSALDHMKH